MVLLVLRKSRKKHKHGLKRHPRTRTRTRAHTHTGVCVSQNTGPDWVDVGGANPRCHPSITVGAVKTCLWGSQWTRERTFGESTQVRGQYCDRSLDHRVRERTFEVPGLFAGNMSTAPYLQKPMGLPAKPPKPPLPSRAEK